MKSTSCFETGGGGFRPVGDLALFCGTCNDGVAL